MSECRSYLRSARRDGSGRFLNHDDPLPQTPLGVALPFFARRAWTTLRGRDGAARRHPDPGGSLAASSAAALSVTWIGHATLLVRLEGRVILTDPVWARAAGPAGILGARRLVAPGLELGGLPPIDAVLVSHNHYDHLDLGTLRRLARRDARTRFLVPLGNAALLRAAGIAAVEELDWGDATDVGGVRAHCLPAQHWSRRGAFDARRALWASWALVGARERWFFAGDSGYFAGFADVGRELGPFTLAAVPIGAYEPSAMMRPVHLDPEEALRVASDLRARRAVGMHFGTFDLTDEPLDEPPRRLRAAARAAGLSEDDVWVLDVGETRAVD